MAAQLIKYGGFLGGSYNTQSIALDGERSINLYFESIGPKANGKSNGVMYRRPGYSLFCTLPTPPLQALYAFPQGSATQLVFAVAGGQFYQIFQGGTYSAIGGSLPATLPGYYISVAANTHQLLILPNDAAHSGYIYDTTAGTLTPISSSGFTGGVTGALVDGYFVVNVPQSNTFSTSSFNDGTTWSGLNNESTEDYPDQLVAVANFLHFLQLFGTSHSEAYYDTGSNSALWARYEGSYQYSGLAAPWSVAYLDNSIFYLGQNDQGAGVLYRLEGFTPKRVSDFAFEQAIQGYPKLSDAYASTIQYKGHLWYKIDFPSANAGTGATWLYDVNEGLMHEWGFWNPGTNAYSSDLGRFNVFAFGQHLAGDYTSGNIYTMSGANPQDNGNPIRWLRSAPHLSSMMTRTFYREFLLDMQTGVGLDGTGLPGGYPGVNPVVGLQWSDDGGFTWGNEVDASPGAIGQYRARCIWEQLGYARDRCFRVFSSDPTVVALVGAYLRIEQGNS